MSRNIILGAARADFTLKKLAMSNVSNAPQKKRWGIGASCSFFPRYLHQLSLIYDIYPNTGKRDVLSGIIIEQREVITVTIREKLCIFIKHEDFGDHELR